MSPISRRNRVSLLGSTTICPLGDEIAEYEETAHVALVNGTVFNGTRRYLYRRPQQPVNGLQILFYETGELFQSLEFHDEGDGRWRATANHLCKADLYLSKYELHGENH